jgi:hypothetical protein
VQEAGVNGRLSFRLSSKQQTRIDVKDKITIMAGVRFRCQVSETKCNISNGFSN